VPHYRQVKESNLIPIDIKGWSLSESLALVRQGPLLLLHKGHLQHLTSKVLSVPYAFKTFPISLWVSGGNVLSMSGTYKAVLFATSEEHSETRSKLVNAVSRVLKLAFQECFWLPTSVLNEFKRDHHSLTLSP